MRFRSRLRSLNEWRRLHSASHWRDEYDDAFRQMAHYQDLFFALQRKNKQRDEYNAVNARIVSKADYANEMQLAWNKFMKALADYDRVLTQDERNSLLGTPNLPHSLRTVGDTVMRFAQWQAGEYFEQFRQVYG